MFSKLFTLIRMLVWLVVVAGLFLAGAYGWHLIQTGQVAFSLTEEQKTDAVEKVATPESVAESTETPPEETPTETIFVTEMLQINAEVQEDGSVRLSWTPLEGQNFHFYKLVRSETNADPRYPEDGSIAYAGDQGKTEYTDTEVEVGKTYYYRACAKLDKGYVACGNVARSQGGSD